MDVDDDVLLRSLMMRLFMVMKRPKLMQLLMILKMMLKLLMMKDARLRDVC